MVNSQRDPWGRVGYTNFISNKRGWNYCFIKFSTFGFAKCYFSLRNDRKVMWLPGAKTTWSHDHMIPALPYEYLNKESKAKQITVIQTSRTFSRGKNLAAVFWSVQSSNSSGRETIVNSYTTVVKILGKVFLIAILWNGGWTSWKKYFLQELFPRALDEEIRLGLVCTAAVFRFPSHELKCYY